MSDTSPAVALLFDDTELGGQLREALHERGARIVHEGGVSSLDGELLHRIGADVLVVNLDDSADDELDHLYELIDGGRPRVVFNDAQASRKLSGWDRARWARHLAVKVLEAGDIDPPRPEDARIVDAPMVEPAETASADVASAEAPLEVAAESMTTAPEEIEEPASMVDSDPMLHEPDFLVHDDPEGRHEIIASAESESLAAELEALLASGELPIDDDGEFGSVPNFKSDAEFPPLHDGNFGAPELSPVDHEAHAALTAGKRSDVAAVQFDQLQLVSSDDSLPLTMPTSATDSVPAKPVTESVSAPVSWALLDDDALTAEPAKNDAKAFGIEKLSAADYLAPDVEQTAPGVEPVMSLELVSMEEAIAPKPYVQTQDHEMVLDELGSALSRIVLLGAAASGVDSVCAFLAALPASSQLTFLHTQHLGEQQSDGALVERLAAHCQLPVRLAKQGGRAALGEVLVVPSGKQVLLRRDGKVELQAIASDLNQDPSIDASFTMAANVFGRDAVAIVFAGRANDAVAGAQAIHDRGGQVWVESSSGEHFADMVSGIFAERLVSFSGTPPDLAAHLIEVFS